MMAVTHHTFLGVRKKAVMMKEVMVK
uniref:Uncharacterized protein n=1 Tax=Arundo donax TaxID=35708 RepID=A0A0A9BR82_ARUDO